MGIFTGGDKQWRDAQVMYGAASVESQFAQQRQQRRNILQDIRQARIAQAYNEWAASSTDEYVTASGTAAATGNIFSNFSGAYRYAIDQSNSSAKIANLEMLQAKMEKRAKKKDKRAATATQITMAAAAIAGGAFGALAIGGMTATGLGVMGGAAVGKGAVSAMKPGRVAKQVSTDAAVQYGIAGATMALGGAMSASSASSTTSTTNTAGITSTGGTVESAWDTASRTGVTTSWLSPRTTQPMTLLEMYRTAKPYIEISNSLYRQSRRSYDR